MFYVITALVILPVIVIGYLATRFSCAIKLAESDLYYDKIYKKYVPEPPEILRITKTEAEDVLGLMGTYTEKDIRSQYRYLAKQCHPDVLGTEEEFIKLVEAKEKLLDEIIR